MAAINPAQYDPVMVAKLLSSLGADVICDKFSAVVDCNSFLVPFLVSGTVGSMMTGLILSQAYTYTWLYYVRGFKQRGVLTLVWVSTVLQVVSAISDLVKLIDVFGIHFGSFSSFVTPRRTDAISYFANNGAQVLTQLFLLYRAWAFSKVKLKSTRAVKIVKLLLGVLLCLILLSSTASMIVTIEVQKIANFMLLAFRTPQTRIYDLAMPLWLAPSTAVDIALAAIIFWELYLPKKERTERFEALHDRLFMFLRIVTQSGIVLAALQLAMLCCWQTQLSKLSPTGWTSWVIFPQTILARYYTVTLLLICTLPYARKVKPSVSFANDGFNERGVLNPGQVVMVENTINRLNSKDRMKRKARVEALSFATSSKWTDVGDLEKSGDGTADFKAEQGSDILHLSTFRKPVMRKTVSTGNLDALRALSIPTDEPQQNQNRKNWEHEVISPSWEWDKYGRTYHACHAYQNSHAAENANDSAEAERYQEAMTAMFPERKAPVYYLPKSAQQTRSMPSYNTRPFSPISNPESLKLYSAVPAVYLSSSTAYANPPTPLSSSNSETPLTQQQHQHQEQEQEEIISPRAAFFKQVQNGEQLPAFIVESGSSDSPVQQKQQLTTYRFGKDFNSSSTAVGSEAVRPVSQLLPPSLIIGSKAVAEGAAVRTRTATATSDVEEGLDVELRAAEAESQSRFSISSSGSRRTSMA